MDKILLISALVAEWLEWGVRVNGLLQRQARGVEVTDEELAAAKKAVGEALARWDAAGKAEPEV